MIKKFLGFYLTALLTMFCTYVPFNLMSSFISKSTHAESLTFLRQMGHASLWYTFIDKSEGSYTTSAGQTNGYIAVIDYKLLLIQVIIITMIFIIIYLFLPKKSSDQQAKKDVPQI